ncbi:uncharacterized protein LOC111099429 isoform X2 [Crassostrea virginica]
MEVSKLETKKWSQNLRLVPPLSQDIIDNWADSVARIPRAKQSKGYSNFIEGYIHDVEVQNVGRMVFIKSKAYPSMRKNDPPYTQMV